MTGYEQLPSGRHGLRRSVVEESQRSRIVRATAELLQEDGYEACTVSAIIARARLSRKTFYDLFADRAEAVNAATAEHEIRSVPTGVPELDLAGWRMVRAGSEAA